MMGKQIPDRWINYKPIGKTIEGTRFIAFKVPLHQHISESVDETNVRLDAKTLLENIPNLGLIIDLTNTYKYYNPMTCFENNGIKHVKIMVPGHSVPSKRYRDLFKKAVQNFLEINQENDKLIGVHCTHGVNRTGFLICNYMVREMNIEPEDAMQRFATARGHPIERDNYKEFISGNMVDKFYNDDSSDSCNLNSRRCEEPLINNINSNYNESWKRNLQNNSYSRSEKKSRRVYEPLPPGAETSRHNQPNSQQIMDQQVSSRSRREYETVPPGTEHLTRKDYQLNHKYQNNNQPNYSIQIFPSVNFSSVLRQTFSNGLPEAQNHSDYLPQYSNQRQTKQERRIWGSNSNEERRNWRSDPNEERKNWRSDPNEERINWRSDPNEERKNWRSDPKGTERTKTQIKRCTDRPDSYHVDSQGLDQQMSSRSGREYEPLPPGTEHLTRTDYQPNHKYQNNNLQSTSLQIFPSVNFSSVFRQTVSNGLPEEQNSSNYVSQYTNQRQTNKFDEERKNWRSEPKGTEGTKTQSKRFTDRRDTYHIDSRGVMNQSDPKRTEQSKVLNTTQPSKRFTDRHDTSHVDFGGVYRNKILKNTSEPYNSFNSRFKSNAIKPNYKSENSKYDSKRDTKSTNYRNFDNSRNPKYNNVLDDLY